MAIRTGFCNPFLTQASGIKYNPRTGRGSNREFLHSYKTTMSSFQFLAPKCLDEDVPMEERKGVHVGTLSRPPKVYCNGKEVPILDFRCSSPWPRRVNIWGEIDFRGDKFDPRFNTFHVYDIVETTEAASNGDVSRFATATRPLGTVITLLGMSRCGKRVAVHVYGICQYFYINKAEVDTACGIRSCSELSVLLAECLRSSMITQNDATLNGDKNAFHGTSFKSASPESFRVEVIERTDVYYYDTQPCAFYRVYSPSSKFTNYLCDNFHPELKKYEGRVDATTRFLMDNPGFVSFGWYQLKPGVDGERVRVRPASRQLTLSDVEIDCMSDNLQAIPNDDSWPDYKLLCFDIECKSGGSNELAFPDATHLEDLVIQISCLLYSIPRQSLEHILLFSLGSCDLPQRYVQEMKDAGLPEPTVLEFDSEFELLIAFMTLVKQYAPEFATGYNIVNFDWAFIMEKLNSIYSLKLDGYGSINRGGLFKIWDVGKSGFQRRSKVKINGLISLDMYAIATEKLKLSSYKLDSVAREALNESKRDLPYKDIPGYYASGPNTRGIIGEYCIQDSALVGKLFFKYLPHLELSAVARLARITLTKAIYDGQQVRIYTCLLGLASSRGFILPDGGYPATFEYKDVIPDVGDVEEEMDEDESVSPTGTSSGRNVGYKGARVFDPDTGFYIDPVVVLDFASLYPSIIQAHNLCFTTLTLNFETVKRLNPSDYATFTVGGKRLFFVRSNVRESLLGVLLKDWLAMRKAIRARIPGSSSDEAVLLDKQQAAIKVVCNSVYGFTGVAQGFLPCLYVAATVTTIGRQMLLSTRDYIHNNWAAFERFITAFPDIESSVLSQKAYEVKVIYGDTDSVFIRFKGVGVEGIAKIGEKMAHIISTALFCPPIKLECEKTFIKLLLITKKKYIGVIYGGKVLMKGVDLVRKNNCQFINDYARKLVELLLYDDTVSRAAAEASCVSIAEWNRRAMPSGMAGFGRIIADAHRQITSPKLDINKFVMTAELSRPPSAYINRRLAHLTVYYKLVMRQGQIPTVRERIPYVIVAPTDEVEADAKSVALLRGDPLQNTAGKRCGEAKRKLIISDLAEDPIHVTSHGLSLNIDYYFSHLIGTASVTFKALFGNDTKLTERLLKRFIPETRVVNVKMLNRLQAAGFVCIHAPRWDNKMNTEAEITEEEQSHQIMRRVFCIPKAILHQS
uniref:DNA polymerase n=1 Tax=Human herpesvirus 3 TaxID=10335 RepID=R4P2L6_HHV3|nr:DNA polymerase catalytic subunit [Human alphaherpesvirus 3]